MKLLLITNNINQVGGIERVLNILSNYFSEELKYDIEILSLFTKESNLFFKYNDLVKITHGNIDVDINNKIKVFEEIRKILKYINADIVITYHGFISNSVLLNKSILKNKKIVVTEHNDYYNDTKKRRILRGILYRNADKVIVLTDKSKQLYSRYLKNVKTIPNTISFKSEKESSLKNKRIISVGRLKDVKGFDDLIKIFKNISYKYNDWELYIVGDGSQREYLQSIINENNLEDKVFIKPFTRNIIDEYLKSSIYALTSKLEGFGLVLTEAKECGLPCVSFDIDAAKEIIIENEDGILVKSRDLKEYEEKLSLLIENEELRRLYGENAKKNVKKYQIDNIAQMWNDLFCSLT